MPEDLGSRTVVPSTLNTSFHFSDDRFFICFSNETHASVAAFKVGEPLPRDVLELRVNNALRMVAA